ncbi:hypothetical protein VDGE_30527 [Verticillium dahliae]|uniref:Uncharacterized protein n=1 Tax=Verticillium dahliae TaxID=27337 RepID=A0A444RL14_VERDA|nr:hypothetical protein VDGE_30527 [Verticillium dahliae]
MASSSDQAIYPLPPLPNKRDQGSVASIGRLRRRIGQLSVGRVFTTFLYPENSTLTMPSGEWRNGNGEKTITVRTIAERGNGEGYYQYTRNASSSPGVERHGLVNMQKPSYSQL